MQKVFGQEYDYLHLQQYLADNISHTEQYIKSGVGKDANRKIYNDVQFDNFDTNNLQKLKELMAQQQIQNIYKDDQLYRFLYSYKFVLDKVIESLKGHAIWLSDPKTFNLTPKVLEILNKGIVYISSRDRQQRPVIIINAHLLDQKIFDVNDFIPAMNTILMIAQQYMFYPGKVENWHIFIETNEAGIFNFPFQLLKKIIEVAASHFQGCLERIYIMNPSTSLNFSWSIIDAFIDERSSKKIQFLKKKDFAKLKEFFDPDTIETTYGGTMPTPNFWPPSRSIPGCGGQSPMNQSSQYRQQVPPQAIQFVQPQYSTPTQQQSTPTQLQSSTYLPNKEQISQPYQPVKEYTGYQQSYRGESISQYDRNTPRNNYSPDITLNKMDNSINNNNFDNLSARSRRSQIPWQPVDKQPAVGGITSYKPSVDYDPYSPQYDQQRTTNQQGQQYQSFKQDTISTIQTNNYQIPSNLQISTYQNSSNPQANNNYQNQNSVQTNNYQYTPLVTLYEEPRQFKQNILPPENKPKETRQQQLQNSRIGIPYILHYIISSLQKLRSYG